MNSPANTSTPANPSVDESTKNQSAPVSVDQLWTTEQAAQYLHVSLKTVFNLRKKGLPFVQLGGAVRFIPEEIKNYLVNSRGLSSHRMRQLARKGGAR
jgi:excisionase family DNA binding protein